MRLLSFLLFGFFSVASAEDVPTFADIAPTSSHANGILYLRNLEIVSGYKDNTFRSEHSVNRAEFSKVLAKLVASPEDIRGCNRSFHMEFVDVPRTAWFSEYVCILAKEGFVTGYKDKTFRPSETLNIAEAAKIMTDAFNLQKTSDTSPWYKPSILALTNAHAIPSDVQATGQALTRGVMADMLWRLKENVQDQDTVDAHKLLDAECHWFVDDQVPHADIQEVRRVWLSWINEARAAENLPPYKQEKELNYSATLWSLHAKSAGSITHKRPGQEAYYDYRIIEKWFANLDLDFSNVQSTTFTENIGWGVYSCTKVDCTQDLIQAIRPTFDMYMSEKGKASAAHYRSVMNDRFRLLGMGIAVDSAEKRVYVTTHYATAISSDPDPICP